MLNLLLTLMLLQSVEQYPPGTVLRITATVGEGSMWNGWAGDITGPENPLEFTVPANDVSFSATATLIPPDPPPPPSGDVTVTIGTQGNVTVAVEVVSTPPPPEPVCGDDVVEAPEICDGVNLNGHDCTTLQMGFTGGTLSCISPGSPSACSFYTGDCTIAPTDPPGWTELANTKLRPVCPPLGFNGAVNQSGAPYDFASKCKAVVTAWNSASFDTQRNRLLLHGGGHVDYWGNEVYALNLSGTTSMVRLNDPSVPFGITASGDCRLSYPDGKVSARHVYDAIEYLPDRDQVILVGGSVPNCGNFANDTWLLDADDLEWHAQPTTGTPPPVGPYASAVHEGGFVVHRLSGLYRLDLATFNWTQAHSAATGGGYHYTGVLDPASEKFLILGNNLSYLYDLSVSPPVRVEFPTTGASALVASKYPGLSYHPPSGKIVGWAGGDAVYVLDLATASWTPQVFSGGLPAAVGQTETGTFHRWSWVPALGAFVAVNSVDNNAFLFRLP